MSRGSASIKRSLRIAYASTTERLSLLLEKYQITYEFGEEKRIKDKVEYFYIKARYLDFNGKVFRETSKVFPLKYYLGEKQVRAHLSEYGQKFLSIIDIYLYEYKGKGILNLNEDNEDDKEGLSTTKGNGMDPSEVKGDDLLIYSLTVPGFSLVELAIADIKEID
ncbi:hypothetical protein F5882DRAFT_375187 [Hyaloscypha sp. PMI_1271]|nr:hypothetical protein F5882DRAFT_375187 [Hyaloscypha sp. PMI_1271]